MFETHKNQILSIFPWPSELGQIYDSCEIVRYVQPRLVEGEKLSNVHIVQWIECSQMLTKILQVVEKKNFLSGISSYPQFYRWKKYLRQFAQKDEGARLVNRKSAMRDNPGPQWMECYASPMLSFFSSIFYSKFNTNLLIAFIPFLFYPFVFVISVLFLFWYNWSGYAVLACFLDLAGTRVQSQLHPPAKRCQKSFLSVSEVQKQEREAEAMAIYKVGFRYSGISDISVL